MSLDRLFAVTGASKTAFIGSWTLPFGRMTAALAKVMAHKTLTKTP